VRTVARGLGWPRRSLIRGVRAPASSAGGGIGTTGLGWPDAASETATVSRETADEPGEQTRAPESVPPAGSTTQHGDEAAEAPAPTVTDQVATSGEATTEGPGGPVVYGAPTVSRETTIGVRTAAQIAAESRQTFTDETPIATAARAAVAVLGGTVPRMPRPQMQRTLVVANQKGGVGKTTSTVNLAASLALHGLNVLVIDLDPQGNASTALGVDHHAEVPSVYEVLVEGRPLAEIVQPVEDIKNLSCAPATIDLAGAEIELVSLVARESRLKRAIEAYHDDDVDYIVIDCPPSLGLLTVNALVASREVVIPIQCEYYALEGLGQLMRNVDLVKAHLNPSLYVSTILLTMYDGRTRLAHQVADEVRTHFGDTVLKTTIPRSVRISEAPSYGQTVMTYDPGSTGALSYLEAARELALRGAAGSPDREAVPAASASET